MKHVKKKFLLRRKLEVSAIEVLDKHIPTKQDTEYAKTLVQSNNYLTYIQTTDGELFQAFKYKFENQNYHIPELDPSVLYFDIGRSFFNRINKSKEIFLQDIKKQPAYPGEMANSFFNVFANATISVPFLHNAVESFINNFVPANYEFKKTNTKGKTESWGKKGIQLTWSFEDKIKIILPDISKQKYYELHSSEYNRIIALKDFRDEIMHTKADVKTANLYEELFVKCLDFKYSDSIEAVKHFINFHKPNWIEPCDCGNDSED